MVFFHSSLAQTYDTCIQILEFWEKFQDLWWHAVTYGIQLDTLTIWPKCADPELVSYTSTHLIDEQSLNIRFACSLWTCLLYVFMGILYVVNIWKLMFWMIMNNPKRKYKVWEYIKNRIIKNLNTICQKCIKVLSEVLPKVWAPHIIFKKATNILRIPSSFFRRAMWRTD